MLRQLKVHLLPSLVRAEELQGTIAVAIDVLRATTTITHALAAGAACVIPCLEVEEALARKGNDPDVVLGGERGGVRIEGFDLGNSPEEYTPLSVGGKRVIFTTTNGTRALRHCRLAARIYAGSFVSFSALCRILNQQWQENPRIDLVCAGTQAEVTREDVLLAGAVVDDLTSHAAKRPAIELNDQAEIAADAWRSAVKSLTGASLESHGLAAALRSSQGGRNVIAIGQEHDIDLAAKIDRFDLVPQLDLPSWEFRGVS